MDEKPLSPLFPFVCVEGGVGAVVTNDLCIIKSNKDEILIKKNVVFISFISPILYKIIEEAKHNRNIMVT